MPPSIPELPKDQEESEKKPVEHLEPPKPKELTNQEI